MRSKHPNKLDAARSIDLKGECWSDEEVRKLASCEAGLPSKLYVNQKLHGYFKDRIVEAILEGQRELPSYKGLVSEYEESLFILSEVEELLDSGNKDDPVSVEQMPSQLVVPEAKSSELNRLVDGFN